MAGGVERIHPESQCSKGRVAKEAASPHTGKPSGLTSEDYPALLTLVLEKKPRGNTLYRLIKRYHGHNEQRAVFHSPCVTDPQNIPKPEDSGTRGGTALQLVAQAPYGDRCPQALEHPFYLSWLGVYGHSCLEGGMLSVPSKVTK